MWRTVKLGDLCDISIGKTPSRGDKRFWDKEKQTDNVWLSIADLTSVSGKYISDSKEYVSDEGANLFKPVPSNTLVMSFKLSIGRLAFTQCELRTNEAIAALPIKDESIVSKEFLYHYLSSMDWNAIASNDEKVKGKTLNKKKLNALEVVLPPLPEQQRIVAKLDAAFAEIDRAIDVAESKYTEVEKLKAALLASALNGEDWKKLKLGDVCKIVNGSTPLRKESKFWADGDVPWFTIDDMRLQGRDIFSTAQHVTQAAVEEKKVKLIPENSVLLCCTASIGEAAIARKEMATNQQFNALTPLRDELSCEYLYYITTTLKKQLMRVSGSTTISFVSMGKLREIEIPLPPLSEQQRIVAKLDAAFAEIDKSAESISEARASYLALKSAILAQELQPPESKAA